MSEHTSTGSSSHSSYQPPAPPAGEPPVVRARSAPRHAGRIVFGSVLLIGAAVATIAVLASHRSAGAEKVATTLAADVSAGPIVRTTEVEMSSPQPKVDFIGEAKPFAAVTLYAKVSGYLKNVNVDMGDRVRAGQTIATIESPETDRAYSAAKADYENKQVTTDRVEKLLAKKFVSPDEADRARTEAAVARERLAGLEEQRQYEQLRAPFAGTVTARYADPGALVQNAASSQTSALPVVTVTQTDSLRVLVYLDQGDANAVRPGTRGVIRIAERPGFSLTATVARVSGQLDSKTRKMVAEFDVNDRSGEIVPGSFVQVEMTVAAPPKPQAPVEALIVRGGKTFVAVVDQQSHIRFRPVVVAANDGRIVTFADGVASGDRLALSLGSAVADGSTVRVAKDGAATAAEAKP